MILFLSDVTLFDPASGAEQVLYQQACGLARKGYQIGAITRANRKSEQFAIQSQHGIQEFRYSADTGNIFRFILQLLRRPKTLLNKIINENDLKIAICHQPFTFISLLMTRSLAGLPVLYLFISPSHQEYLVINEKQIWPVKVLNAGLRRIIEGYCLKKADKVMYLSQYMKRKALKYHGLNERCLVCNPAGVDLERFKPVADRVRMKEALGLPADKFHLLTVRNLERRMGLDNLIKALSLLKQKGVPAHLVIGGAGPEKENLQHLVARFDLQNDVQMAGFIPDEDLPNYYGAADFFILPTRELEGFGLVTIESMACETPVLGTPVGATTEILSGFNPAMLFKGADPAAIAEGIQAALNKYFPNQSGYRQLRTQCREHVQKTYSWQRHIDRLQAVIEELAGKSETATTPKRIP